MQYRRARIKGGTYFFTVNTHNNRTLFNDSENIELLGKTFRRVKKLHPFKIDAFILLPDHLHCIWTLPEGDNDYSTRWRLIKTLFTKSCKDSYKLIPSSSRAKKREQAIWQRRFWQHLIRGEEDFIRHVEYIHYNPVKHGWSKAPKH
jgi:putative transposase